VKLLFHLKVIGDAAATSGRKCSRGGDAVRRTPPQAGSANPKSLDLVQTKKLRLERAVASSMPDHRCQGHAM